MLCDKPMLLMSVIYSVMTASGELEGRDYPDISWRLSFTPAEVVSHQIAIGLAGDSWIGSCAREGAAMGKILRYVDGVWRSVDDFPGAGRCAGTLDVDPDGGLWVFSFNPRGLIAEDLQFHRFNGEAWSRIPAPGDFFPAVLDMVSPDEGWIGAYFGEIIHFRDGVFEVITLEPQEPQRTRLNVYGLKVFDDSGDGWAVGEQGLVLRLRDGVWLRAAAPEAFEGRRLWGVDRDGAGRVWVVGERGLIAHYDGSDWRIVESPTTRSLFAIDMVGARDGWAAGDATLLRFNGSGWRSQFIPVSPSKAWLRDIAMAPPGYGWILGNGVALQAAVLPPVRLRHVAEPQKFPMLNRGAELCAALDLDGDGDLDLLTFERGVSRWFRNERAGGFVEAPLYDDGPDLEQKVAAFVSGDLDGDGDLDVYAYGASGNHRLSLNQGDGRMRTDQPGLATGQSPERVNAAYAVDMVGNGRLDLYLIAEKGPRPHNYLYYNQGGAAFRRKAHGEQDSHSFLSFWGDLNGDGAPDLLLPDQDRTGLYLNRGDGRFEKRESGIDRGATGWQGALVDLDVDGDLDLVLGDRGIAAYFNDGAARFQRRDGLFGPSSDHFPFSTETTSVCNVGDIDHDGFPDLLVQTVVEGETRLRLFVRRADGRYEDVAPSAGLDDKTGRTAVFADWDDDGDLDIFIGGGQKSYLFENGIDNDRYLKVKLKGVLANPTAVGARVFVYQAGHLGDPRYLAGFQQLGLGMPARGFHNLSELHFGLPTAGSYDVRAVFPGGRAVSVAAVTAGQTLTIAEYSGLARWALQLALTAGEAWRRAEVPLELVKLAFVLLTLALAVAVGPKWGAGRILATPGVQLLAIVLYGSAALAFTGAVGMVHAFQLIAWISVLSVALLGDRAYGQWKQRHFLGHFRLLEPLGRGGMGVVYRARNAISKQLVALKTLHPEIIESEEGRLRFLREAAILRQLDHPNIVAIYETGEADGKGYISMELLRGQTLKRVLQRDGVLSPEAAAAIGGAVASALAYMHRRGALHRDLKTENIFVLEKKAAPSGPDGLEPSVKLLDFGLSRSLDMRAMTRVRDLVGTLVYMAPERLRGEPGDPRSDIYALGVVLYEAVSGQLPFEADNDLALMEKIRAGDAVPFSVSAPDLSPALAALIQRAMARQAADRFATAAELAGDLQRLGSRHAQTLETPRPALATPQPTPRASLVPSPRVASERAKAHARTLRRVDRETGVADPWQAKFHQAKQLLAKDRFTDAYALMLACMGDVERIVASLDEEAWRAYRRDHPVEELQGLLERLAAV